MPKYLIKVINTSFSYHLKNRVFLEILRAVATITFEISVVQHVQRYK